MALSLSPPLNGAVKPNIIPECTSDRQMAVRFSLGRIDPEMKWRGERDREKEKGRGREEVFNLSQWKRDDL